MPIPFVLRDEPQPKTEQLSPGIPSSFIDTYKQYLRRNSNITDVKRAVISTNAHM